MFRLLGLGLLLLTALSACSVASSASDAPAVPTAVGNNTHIPPLVHQLQGVQQGMATVFTLPSAIEIKNLVSISSNMWFGESNSNKIGKINDQGQFSEYTLPTAAAQPSWGTAGIAGNFWFSEEGANRIGQVSPQGDVTEYSIPTPHAKPGQTLLWGNMVWFTETGARKLGHINQSSQIVEFPLDGTPDQLATAGSEESNGHLWFTEPGSRKVGYATFDGQISEISLPTSITSLDSVMGDGGGNLWFTTGQSSKDQLGYVTPAGHFTLFSTGRQNIVDQLLRDGDTIDFIEHNNGTIWTINNQGAIQVHLAAPPDLRLLPPLTPDPDNGSYWYAKTEGQQSQLWKLNISPYGP